MDVIGTPFHMLQNDGASSYSHKCVVKILLYSLFGKNTGGGGFFFGATVWPKVFKTAMRPKLLTNCYMTKIVKLWVGMQKQAKMNKTAIRPKIVNKLLYDQNC